MTAKLPWPQPTKGPPSSSWGHWVSAPLLGPVHEESPWNPEQEVLQPSQGIGLMFRDPQHHNLSALPHPHPEQWHSVRVVAAPGLCVPAPETLVLSSHQISLNLLWCDQCSV